MFLICTLRAFSSPTICCIWISEPFSYSCAFSSCHYFTTQLLIFCSWWFRRLTELALLYCQRIENDAFVQIGRGCKFLQALHLVDCARIGDDAICSIAEGCKNLKKLHIRRCYEVLIHLFAVNKGTLSVITFNDADGDYYLAVKMWSLIQCNNVSLISIWSEPESWKPFTFNVFEQYYCFSL